MIKLVRLSDLLFKVIGILVLKVIFKVVGVFGVLVKVFVWLNVLVGVFCYGFFRMLYLLVWFYKFLLIE